MDNETKKILHHTPFNSYNDLFSAVFNNKASIKLSNSACRQIAAIQKPVYANMGLHLGLIPSAIMTIIFSVYAANYYLLLLLILECVFPFALYLLNNFRIKTWYIAAIVVLIDLFIVDLPTSILIATLSWVICSWAVSWWQKKIYTLSVKILQYREDAFIWAYNSHNLIIEDCYGNTYSKLKQTQSEIAVYKRLLKILEIGSGIESVDSAITTFSSFYIKKGMDIPPELYLGSSSFSEIEKYENLIKILELGIGVSGVENVMNNLIDFYQSKGIVFPDYV